MQDNWQWCNKCSGLAFLGNASWGTCPSGGTHNFDGSGNYELAGADESTDGQEGWRWCVRCQGLYYIGNNSHGHCPAGGAHVEQGSGNYRLRQDGSGQNQWRWCVNCQGLWFAGREVDGTSDPWFGKCPAPGHDAHASAGSGDYVITLVNSPAGPPPITGVTVVGLENPPPHGWSIGDPKWLRISWRPYAGNSDGAVIELYEGSGTYSDRFITELPITAVENDQNMFGDIFYGDNHCFSLRVRNRYGYSSPATGCGATLQPPPARAVVPSPSSDAVALALSVGGNDTTDNVEFSHGSWTLTSPSGGTQVITIPVITPITSFTHPGPMTTPEGWEAQCTIWVSIYPAGTPRPTEPSRYVTDNESFSWAVGGGQTLRATFVYDGGSAEATFSIS